MKTEEFIYKLTNPQVFTGQEINAVRKPNYADLLNVCLVFPDVYEIGMSHDGLKILYHLLNRRDDVNAERCFLPGRASLDTFIQHQFPLFSLENKQPLKSFDLIGFSLLSEMTFTNVLQVLDLSHIPLKRQERDDSHPIIAAGGISAVNPEPLRDFVDIFAIGDGEVIFPEIVEILKETKDKNIPRAELLARFDALEGIYVPALAPLEKKGRFYVPQIKSTKSGEKRKPVIKQLGADIRDHDVIVPITNVVFNRLTVEIARGCPQNCRFCQARSYYSPYRARSLRDTLQAVKEGLAKTGFDTFSLSSLSSGDYPQLETLLKTVPHIMPTGTSLSLPSLRPSSISDSLLSTIAQFRRTGITIVPEAGTERLRKVINKNVTHEEIFNAVELALKFHWQKIKLYFMIGLPTETIEDIEGIVDLVESIRERAKQSRKKIAIHVSLSSFVPKPHTPLQWARREDLDSIYKKVRFLKDKLGRYRNIDLDYHSPNKGEVETILTRGDYRVGELLLQAYREGEILSAWDSEFHYPVWERLIEANPEYNDFLTEIGTGETLPWDFLLVNYKKEYLSAEYRKALEETETPVCSDKRCSECKGCFFGFKPVDEKQAEETPPEPVEPETVEFNKVRVFYRKTGNLRFFSQLSIMTFVERLIRRSGVLFRCTEGFHPRMRMVTCPALPVFATGLDESVELFMDARLSEEDILTQLNDSLPDVDFRFTGVRVVNERPQLTRDIHFIDFELRHPALREKKDLIEQTRQLMIDTDIMNLPGDVMELKIDWSKNGQERFAKIYKTIDPEKAETKHLTRVRITFK